MADPSGLSAWHQLPPYKRSDDATFCLHKDVAVIKFCLLCYDESS